MKKHLILLLCLLLSAGATIQAQKKDKKDKNKRVRIGIKAGLNRSNVKLDDNGKVDLNATAKAALNTGLYARFFLAKGRIIIQPEMLYSREGFVYDSTVVSGQGAEDVRTKLSFMSIPLNITVRPTKHFNLQFGPSFAYLMGAKQNSDNIDNEGITDIMNRAEAALNFGVGFDLLKVLNVNLRYKYGLTQLNKQDINSVKENPLEAVELFNRMFQVSVGLNLFRKFEEFGGASANAQQFNHFKEKRTFFKKQY